MCGYFVSMKTWILDTPVFHCRCNEELFFGLTWQNVHICSYVRITFVSFTFSIAYVHAPLKYPVQEYICICIYIYSMHMWCIKCFVSEKNLSFIPGNLFCHENSFHTTKTAHCSHYFRFKDLLSCAKI